MLKLRDDSETILCQNLLKGASWNCVFSKILRIVMSQFVLNEIAQKIIWKIYTGGQN